MKAFSALFNREMGERWRVLPVSLLLGLVPFAAPLVGRIGSEPAARHATAAVLAAVMTLVLAFAFGSSTLAGDLAERRLSFYYAVPLPGWVIWAGKLGAALVLCLASSLLTLLPTWLSTPGDTATLLAPFGPWTTIGAASAWFVGTAILLLVAHVLSVIARARSAWTALDLAALVGIGCASWWAAAALLDWSADRALDRLAVAGAIVLLLVLIAATALQTLLGRTDLQRSHRVLSVTLWPPLVVAAAIAVAYAVWFIHPTPNDLHASDQVAGDRSGRLALVAGNLGHRDGLSAAFLLERASGRWWLPHLLEPARRVTPDLVIADDGASAIWLEPIGGGKLGLSRLSVATRTITPVTVPELTLGVPFALSADGSEFVGLSRGRLFVDQLPTGPLVASVAFPQPGALRELRFLDRDHVRTTTVEYAVDGTVAIVRDLEISTGRLATRATIHDLAPFPFSLNPAGDRLLAHPRGDHQRADVVIDPATGERIAVIAPPDGARLLNVEILGDGRLFAISATASEQRIALLDRDGRPVPGAHPAVFPLGHRLVACGEPAAGQLVVARTQDEPAADSEARADVDFFLADLVSGSVRTIARGQAPSPAVNLVSRVMPRWVLVRSDRGWFAIDPRRGAVPVGGG